MSVGRTIITYQDRQIRFHVNFIYFQGPPPPYPNNQGIQSSGNPAKRSKDDVEHFIKNQAETLSRNVPQQTLQKNENILNAQEEQILHNVSTQCRQNSRYESTPYQAFSTSNETKTENINTQLYLAERRKTNIMNEENAPVQILSTKDDEGM